MRIFLLVAFLNTAICSVASADGSPNYHEQTLLVPLMSAVIFWWIQRKFKDRSPFIRYPLALLGVICTAGALSAGPKLIDQYWALHDPTAGQKAFERDAFASFPLFKVVAEKEPALWEKARDESVALFQAHGGKLDPEVALQMPLIFGVLNARIIHIALFASDASLLEWVSSETDLNTRLLASNPQRCGNRLQGIADATEFPPSDKLLLLKMQADLGSAYAEGLKPSVNLPTQETGDMLVKKAIFLPSAPFTTKEVQAFGAMDKQTPEATCQIWVRFYKNLLALPTGEAANLQRYFRNGG